MEPAPKLNVPLISADEPVGRAIVVPLPEVEKDPPAAIVKALTPPEIVNVVLEDGTKATIPVLVICNFPIVCDEADIVTFPVGAVLNINISVVAGVVLVGVQFVAVVQAPPAALLHVYVACENTFVEKNSTIANEHKYVNTFFIYSRFSFLKLL